MTLAEIREMYHDGSIPKKARSEIIQKFMKEFGYNNSQRLKMRLATNSMEIPTPDEFEWLEKTISRYHSYYQENQTTLVP